MSRKLDSVPDSLAAGIAVTNAILQEDPGDVARYFSHNVVQSLPDPERRLALAVLLDTLQLLFKTSIARRKQRDYQDALAWLLNESQQHVFYFRSICEYLDLNAALLQHRMLCLLDEAARTGTLVGLKTRRTKRGAPRTIGSRRPYYQDLNRIRRKAPPRAQTA